jgi:hypothetical protein
MERLTASLADRWHGLPVRRSANKCAGITGLSPILIVCLLAGMPFMLLSRPSN